MQLLVGRVAKAHGVRGELAVEVRTDDPQRRFAAGCVLDTEPAERGPLTVDAARWHRGRLLVRFREVPDRSAAEALRGTLLVVDSSSSPATEDPDEFWDHDLIGLTAALRAGEVVGEVVDVLHPPGADLLVVRRDEREVLVPFVAAIVPEVDLAAGRVVLDPPEGLLDLDEA